jgi:hypothetical protein
MLPHFGSCRFLVDSETARDGKSVETSLDAADTSVRATHAEIFAGERLKSLTANLLKKALEIYPWISLASRPGHLCLQLTV